MRHAYFSIIAVVVLAGLSTAGMVSSPGWDNDPYFTHQTWSFATGENGTAPDDGGAGNRYGTPTLTMSNATWDGSTHTVYDLNTYQPVGDFAGGWMIAGPQANTQWFEINVPNSADPTRTKEVWFQIIASVDDVDMAGQITDRVSFDIYADGIMDDAHKFLYDGQVGALLGVGETGRLWLWFEGTFSYTPQPSSEKMVFAGTLDSGDVVALDRITVETRCIPEPATLCLLGAGVLALRRRRS